MAGAGLAATLLAAFSAAPLMAWQSQPLNVDKQPTKASNAVDTAKPEVKPPAENLGDAVDFHSYVIGPQDVLLVRV